MEVPVVVNSLVKLKTKSYFKHNKVSLVVSYHPLSSYTSEENQSYLDQVTNLVDKIPKGNLNIISADINASIGTQNHTSEEKDEKNVIPNIIVPHRNQNLNQRGENIFYRSRSYDTWLHPATKEGYQLYHFFILTIHAKYIIDVKWKMNRVPSDHEENFSQTKTSQLQICTP